MPKLLSGDRWIEEGGMAAKVELGGVSSVASGAAAGVHEEAAEPVTLWWKLLAWRRVPQTTVDVAEFGDGDSSAQNVASGSTKAWRARSRLSVQWQTIPDNRETPQTRPPPRAA
jgi:hypothetical protein